ncbi:MAG: FMN-binding protein [Clostridia bacterium]|nr:FMN-binding protein [Clostridia bacterium]
MKRFCCIALVLAMLVCAIPAALAEYAPGTYTAEAIGHEASLKVTVTVDETSITAVDLDLSNETPEIGGAAKDALIEQILSAQSADIDGVSGATETSTGVKLALTDALNQAAGITETERTAVADGTYSGTAPSFGLTGPLTAEVTLADGKITEIKVVSETDSLTGEWFGSAEELLIPRIIESQSLAVDAITGATTSSNGIRNAVAAAIDAAGGDSLQWYTEVPKKDDTVVIEDYDVIVVGLGGSGVFSYCAAADQGASVFGIEAAGKIGGNSVCTYGPMALNSEYLKEKFNGGEDYINPDDVYQVWMDYVESDEKADVIREAVYNSGTALDYYVNNFGFEFEGLGLLGSFVVPEWDKEWCVYSADEGNTSWNILGPNKTFQFLRALDIANAKNEKNQYMTELTADSLIFDEGGKAIGVKATYYDGTTYEIYGKAIILATGGFLGNDEMMVEYLGSTVNAIGDTVNKGAGIKMGQSAGGALYMMGTLPMVHISQVKNIIRTDDLTADQKAILTALALTTDRPMITTTGEPWGNVNQSGTTAEGIEVEIVFAPNFMYYNLYTQADIDAIRENGLSEAQAAATSTFLAQGGTLPAAGTPVPDIDDILDVASVYGDVIVADGISGLAAAIGCDEATLSETLNGEDAVYYAVPCTSWAYGTVGGLDVDVNMNVLREDGTPIENLFAVGQDSEGVCNKDGKAYTPWGGQAQSWTFVSGEIAGKQAAALAD